MIPYGHQSINQQDIAAVKKQLTSGWLTQGPIGKKFEAELSRVTGTKYAIAVSSGTAALHVAYLAAGIGRGDEVITTANTFVATTNMLLAVGVKPVFCDIRLDTYNIDQNKIEEKITKKTKAIVAVHFAGQPAAMAAIKKIARRHQLLLIADACHALGATYQSKKIGRVADLSVFSFHPVKSITTGEGGAIVTDDKKLADKMFLLRTHGIHKNTAGRNVMTELGYNYRLSDIQAALGVSQLRRLNLFIKKRQAVVKWYAQELKNNPHVVLPQQVAGGQSAWHLYVIRVNPRSRDQLAKYLSALGIGVNFHYPAVYAHPYYRRNGYRRTSLLNTDLYAATSLTLPCYPDLTQARVKFIAKKINSFFAR